MEKIKLTKVFRKQETSQKTGKQYTRLALKTDKYGDKWLSGFGNKDNENWKEGDEVEITVKQNGEYLNFETPKKEDSMLKDINSMAFAIHGLQADMKKVINLLQGVKEQDEPPLPEADESSDDMDVPF